MQAEAQLEMRSQEEQLEMRSQEERVGIGNHANESGGMI